MYPPRQVRKVNIHQDFQRPQNDFQVSNQLRARFEFHSLNVGLWKGHIVDCDLVHVGAFQQKYFDNVQIQRP